MCVQDCFPSSLVVLAWNPFPAFCFVGGPVWGVCRLYGKILVTKRTSCPEMCLTSRTTAVPCPHVIRKPLPTHASTTDTQHSQADAAFSFSLVPLYTREFLLMSSKVLFPLVVCGSSVIKSCPSRSDFLRILSFFAGFPSWEIRCGG